jgi:hypothetical protein
LDALLAGQIPEAARNLQATTIVHNPSLHRKRRMRAVGFGLCFSMAFLALAAFGAISSKKVSAESNYWRGLTVPLRIDVQRLQRRDGLLVGGIGLLLLSLLIVRQDLAATGRGGSIALFLLLASLSVYVGFASIPLNLHSQDLGKLKAPVHTLICAVVLWFLAVGHSWPKYAGSLRYHLYRFLLVGSLFLFYAFSVQWNLALPIRTFEHSAEILMPLATLSFIAGCFGMELSVGYRWSGWSRWCGLVLYFVSVSGLLLIGWVGSLPVGAKIDWMNLVIHPFQDFARAFRFQGGPLGLSYFLLVLAFLTYSAGSSKGKGMKG